MTPENLSRRRGRISGLALPGLRISLLGQRAYRRRSECDRPGVSSHPRSADHERALVPVRGYPLIHLVPLPVTFGVLDISMRRPSFCAAQSCSSSPSSCCSTSLSPISDVVSPSCRASLSASCGSAWPMSRMPSGFSTGSVLRHLRLRGDHLPAPDPTPPPHLCVALGIVFCGGCFARRGAGIRRLARRPYCILWGSPWARRTYYESAIWVSALVLTTAVYLHGSALPWIRTSVSSRRNEGTLFALIWFAPSHKTRQFLYRARREHSPHDARYLYPPSPGVGAVICSAAGYVVVQLDRERPRRPNPLRWSWSPSRSCST